MGDVVARWTGDDDLTTDHRCKCCKLLPPSILSPEVAQLLPPAHQARIRAIASEADAKRPRKRRQKKLAESKQGHEVHADKMNGVGL